MGFNTWSDEELKEQLRIKKCETLDFIFEQIAHLIHKGPTYLVANPKEAPCQLGLIIYKMAHGCSFKVIWVCLGFLSLWLQRHSIILNTLSAWYSQHIIKYMILTLYHEFVCLTRTKADWANICEGFIENYEFPCVGTWEELHVHVACW